MKAATILFIVAFAIVAVVAEKVQYYSDKYDDVNADEILANTRLRGQYLSCYMGTGPCATPDAKFLKDTFPEALVTKCKRCTEKQKIFFEKITIYYTEKEPETWNKILTHAIEKYRNARRH